MSFCLDFSLENSIDFRRKQFYYLYLIEQSTSNNLIIIMYEVVFDFFAVFPLNF